MHPQLLLERGAGNMFYLSAQHLFSLLLGSVVEIHGSVASRRALALLYDEEG